MIFDILLTRSKAFNLTLEKYLTKFFTALLILRDDPKNFIDGVWLDIFPDTTRQLNEWEHQFGLLQGPLPDDERRQRLLGAWRARGGQDPTYIQKTLQDAGFDVYVHEFWETPRTSPPTVRDPNQYIIDTGLPTWVTPCGEGVFNTNLLCGEALPICGDRSGTQVGYLLVNKPGPDYIIPADPSKYPYFLYIGGETFPNTAQVSSSRRTEFETLCLKICPTQQWLGILVEYN
jgi:hypothetical protein